MKKLNLLYILMIIILPSIIFLLISCEVSQSAVSEQGAQINNASDAEIESINNEPIAKIGFAEEELLLNKEITFYSESTDVDNDTLTYKWTLPDGTNRTDDVFYNRKMYQISIENCAT